MTIIVFLGHMPFIKSMLIFECECLFDIQWLCMLQLRCTSCRIYVPLPSIFVFYCFGVYLRFNEHTMRKLFTYFSTFYAVTILTLRADGLVRSRSFSS